MWESVLRGLGDAIATFGLPTVLVFILMWMIWKMWQQLLQVIKESNNAMLKVTKALNKVYTRLGR